MKVFISWSGGLSHKIALIFRDWLPAAIQSIEPYVSSEDIDKGARWGTEISKELESSSYGILCVTRENMHAPWLNFEAGALSKAFDKSRVSPFLFGVKRSEIKGPILQFQSTIFGKEDIKKLLLSLNKASDDSKLDDSRLKDIFEVWWPKLEDSLNKLIKEKPNKGDDDKEEKGVKESNIPTDILEELLELSRRQYKILNSPDELSPPEYIRNVFGQMDKLPFGHPVFEDLAESWLDLIKLVSSFEDEELIPVEVFKERINRINRPVEYILSRMTKLSIRNRNLFRRFSSNEP